MIQIRNLCKDFGLFRAVDGVTFEVRKGDILGFLGPNGAGKSTTMKMITGFLPPSQGTALIGGHDIREEPIAAKGKIGYLPENGPLYEEMNVLEFLEFIAEMRGYRGLEINQAVTRVFELCHLHEVKFQTIETLSKGFRRRVGLGQAVLHDPPCLILDEPTDGLDPNQKQEVRQLVTAMAEEKVILLSTHILEEVEAMCNRVIIIAEGKIRVDDTPAGLRRRHPHHEALVLECPETPRDTLMGELMALSPVRAVEDFDSEALLIFPEAGNGPALRQAVWELASRLNWPIERLETAPTPLEDVFHRLTLADTVRT